MLTWHKKSIVITLTKLSPRSRVPICITCFAAITDSLQNNRIWSIWHPKNMATNTASSSKKSNHNQSNNYLTAMRISQFFSHASSAMMHIPILRALHAIRLCKYCRTDTSATRNIYWHSKIESLTLNIVKIQLFLL